MCAALRSEEGGGSRMRIRPKRCTSPLRSARTLTPTPLPAGEGLSVATRTNAATASSTSRVEPFSLREKVAAAG